MSQNPYAVENQTAPPRVGAAGVSVMQPLVEAAGWIKLLAWVTIVGGVIQCLTISGIIIGWLPIWMGIILKRAAENLELSRQTNDQRLYYETSKDLAKYFTIAGVLALIGLIFLAVILLVVIVLLIVGVAGAAMN